MVVRVGCGAVQCLLLVAAVGLGWNQLQARPFPDPEEEDEMYQRELARIMGNECPIVDCEYDEDFLPCPDNKRETEYFTHIGFHCPGCRICIQGWNMTGINQTESPLHNETVVGDTLGETSESPETQESVVNAGRNKSRAGNVVVETFDMIIDEIIEEVDDFANATDNSSESVIFQNTNQQWNITSRTESKTAQQIPSRADENETLRDSNSESDRSRVVAQFLENNALSTPKDRRSATARPITNLLGSTLKPVLYQEERGTLLLEGDPKVLRGILEFLRNVVGDHVNLHVLASTP